MTTILDGIKDYLLNMWNTKPWTFVFIAMATFFFIGILFKKLFGIQSKKKDA